MLYYRGFSVRSSRTFAFLYVLFELTWSIALVLLPKKKSCSLRFTRDRKR